jgi:hypothetical protein
MHITLVFATKKLRDDQVTAVPLMSTTMTNAKREAVVLARELKKRADDTVTDWLLITDNQTHLFSGSPLDEAFAHLHDTEEVQSADSGDLKVVSAADVQDRPTFPITVVPAPVFAGPTIIDTSDDEQ